MVLGIGFLLFTFYLGGQNEVQNAVDAGVLNLGRQILDDKSKIAVKLSSSDVQQCFNDVTNDIALNPNSTTPSLDGEITLRRINRVWGEALLIAINADASKTGSMVNNAGQAVEGAQQISDQLQGNLTNQQNLYGFFTDIAAQNSLRMLGKNSGLATIPGNNWQNSFMKDGTESNISLSGSPSNNFNLPPNYNLDQGLITQTKRKVQQNANLYYFKGYRPITIGSNTFWQVPFECDGKPYLVSKTDFDKAAQNNVSEIGQWTKPVPNAYEAMGKGGGATTANESAISRVLTNPNEPFQMSIPHGFIHIKVEQMQVHWYFMPLGFPVDYTQSDYGFIPDLQSGIPCPGGGILCTTVTPTEIMIGSEVAGADIYRDIYSYPDTDTSLVDQTLVNRCNEMITAPGVTLTTADVYSCLHNSLNIPLLVAGTTDYYIYSKDGKSISCLPAPLAFAPNEAPWLALITSQTADGDSGTISSDVDFEPGVPPIPPIPMVVPDPYCSPVPFGCWEWSTVHKEIDWTPGSGYNKNLGELDIKRWTNVYSLGVCNPF